MKTKSVLTALCLIAASSLNLQAICVSNQAFEDAQSLYQYEISVIFPTITQAARDGRLTQDHQDRLIQAGKKLLEEEISDEEFRAEIIETMAGVYEQSVYGFDEHGLLNPISEEVRDIFLPDHAEFLEPFLKAQDLDRAVERFVLLSERIASLCGTPNEVKSQN